MTKQCPQHQWSLEVLGHFLLVPEFPLKGKYKLIYLIYLNKLQLFNFNFIFRFISNKGGAQCDDLTGMCIIDGDWRISSDLNFYGIVNSKVIFISILIVIFYGLYLQFIGGKNHCY